MPEPAKPSRCNRQFISKVVAVINIIVAVIVVSFGNLPLA